ncbi:MAG: DUF4160 domain-containing protein [Bdellovibrio sp.]
MSQVQKTNRFRIDAIDLKPAHVHVIGPDAEAKFDISTMECTENHGFSEKSVKRIKQYFNERKDRLREAWDEYQE